MRLHTHVFLIALLICSYLAHAASARRELHIGSDHEGDHYYSLLSAANFDNSSGVETRISSEGVRSIRFMNAGDYAAYQVNLAAAGTYLFQLRVSSPLAGAGFELVNMQTQQVLASAIALNATGDWSQWVTVEREVVLPSGFSMIQVRAIQNDWELLWLSLLELVETDAPLLPTETQVPAVPTAAAVVPPPVSVPVMPPIQTQISPSVVTVLPRSGIPSSAPSTVPTAMPTRIQVALPGEATGFVHAHERLIVGPDGNQLQLKGMILGGWMVLQPYLVLAENYANTSSEYFDLVEKTVGEEKMKEFRQAWLENFVTYEDVRELKSLGFNTIKAPLHYELFTLSIQEEPVRGVDTWLMTGFDLVDQLLEWAAEEEIYVLLDLMAAPGGQNYDNATDYDPNFYSFWQDGENQRKAISLWREIAFRYADNPWVAGYDLLNSVGWNFDENDRTKHQNGCDEEVNAPLRLFYDGAINAIRDVDTNHLIVIAGNCWGTNHKGLFPLDDDNVALGFRMSWTYLLEEANVDMKPQETIFEQLFEKEKYNIPLVMTHAGDYHNKWYSDTTAMLESNDIGWTWFTWKKMNSTDSPFEIYSSTSYNTLLTHWDYECDDIDEESAFRALMQIVNNTQLSKARRNRPVIEALLHEVRNCDSALEYNVTSFEPRQIEAEDFCMSSGVATEIGADVDSVGSNVGWLNTGSTISYKIAVSDPGTYNMKFRIASPSGDGGFTIQANGVKVGETSGFTRTFGWQSWADVETSVVLPAGVQVLDIISTGPGWNLNWLSLSFSSA